MREIIGLVWVVTVWCLAQDRISVRASAFQHSNEITLAEQVFQAALRGGVKAQASTLVYPGFFLVDDDFQVVSFTGDVRSKAQRVEDIRRRSPDTSFPTVGEVDVQVFGATAVMRALQEPPTSGQPAFRWTRLWVRVNDQWRQAINQQTALAEPR